MKEVIKNYQLNNLCDELINIIKNRNDIFKPLNIIVPNIKTEKWIKSYWLKHQNDVLMNVKFTLIDNALLSFIDSKKTYKLLNKEELKSLIIKFLVNDNNINFPKEITEYLYNDNKINQIKIYDLANQLANLYTEYDNDQIDITGWQKELYDVILNDATNYNLTTLSYLFNNEKYVKKSNDITYFFGFIEFTSLQEKIIDKYSKYSDIKLFLLEEDINYNKIFKLTSAPSKLREVESVHTKICELLKDPSNKYDDFLVLATNISEYENVIPRVFNQDNVNFPNIPYKINNKKRIETNLSLGLKKLFEILNKKFYTRADFISIINNKDVQKCKGISEDDVINFANSIVKMNAYRNGTNRDDWEYAKKRVLLSKLSSINDINNNIIELSNKSYLPYTSIEFTDESIVKFINIIDDLDSWLKISNNIQFLNNENLLLIKNELIKWFSIKDDNDFETNSYFKNILSDIDFWIRINISNNDIPLNTLFYMLIDSSTETKLKGIDYFTKGITFTDFDENTILSTKHIFFLNASSTELPKQKIKSELDLRKEPFDDKKTKRAFSIQYQNAVSCFNISYIDKDLKTDEDFYPSTYILNLKNKSKFEEEKITLDEIRTWSKLYTKKEYKDKNYYTSLLDIDDETSTISEIFNLSEKTKKIKIKEMAEYLEEPLMSKSKRLFGKDFSLEEDFKEEFEPFTIDNISKSVLVKKICIDILSNKKEITSIEEYDELRERFNLEHKLPNINETFNEESFKKVFLESIEIINYIKEKTNENYDVVKLPDISLYNNETEWTLTCDQELCISINERTRRYFQFKKNLIKANEIDFLYLYVFSLMDVSNLSDNTYEIILDRGVETSFNITPYKAKELLNNIYDKMNDYSDNVYLPLRIFDNEKITSLQGLIENLKKLQGSPWTYFDDKNLFDYETQLGYTNENFNEKYKQKRKEHIDLIEYMEQIEESEDEK